MSDTSTLIAIKYKGQMIDLPTGGGSVDLSNYYTKTQIDTSIASNYASKSDVSVLDTSVSKLWDTSTQGSGSGISLQYLTQAEYDALQVKDSSTLYLIEETL